METASVHIVGTGNMAWHLINMLGIAGVQIQTIFGRDVTKAQSLAALCNAKASDQFIPEPNKNVSIYFLAIADDIIREVGKQFNNDKDILIHLSGAVESTTLDFGTNMFGVYYPLQSFSKNTITNYKKIPVFLISRHDAVREILQKIAESISTQVLIIDDEQKKHLHLAAVFVNNFTNYLFEAADRILADKNLTFDLLLPLMEETVNKVIHHAPAHMQTGPARRGDIMTIQKHLELLLNYPELTEVYTVLSKSIQKKYADT